MYLDGFYFRYFIRLESSWWDRIYFFVFSRTEQLNAYTGLLFQPVLALPLILHSVGNSMLYLAICLHMFYLQEHMGFAHH
jgi:hypothetical protein